MQMNCGHSTPTAYTLIQQKLRLWTSHLAKVLQMSEEYKTVLYVINHLFQKPVCETPSKQGT